MGLMCALSDTMLPREGQTLILAVIVMTVCFSYHESPQTCNLYCLQMPHMAAWPLMALHSCRSTPGHVCLPCRQSVYPPLWLRPIAHCW